MKSGMPWPPGGSKRLDRVDDVLEHVQKCDEVERARVSVVQVPKPTAGDDETV